MSDSADKYKILQPIGRGGMGEVYLAKDLRLDRKVAIKYLREDLPEYFSTQQLDQEAQLLAKLNHPNIVQIYDLVEFDGRPALVMEYVEGRNLHIQLRERRVGLSEILRWISEIAAGISSAHIQGIVHNDLKAENVLIGLDGTAKVTDFGIANSAHDKSQDVLALGVLAKKLMGDSAKVSPALQFLLAQLTHKNPQKRPSSSEAAIQLKEAWIDSTQEETAPLSQNGKSTSGVRQKVGFAVGGTLALFIGLAYNYFQPAKVERKYVAILPTELTTEGESPTNQHQVLRNNVQQALQNSAMGNPSIALVSAHETAEEKGSFSDIAEALGAQELVVSSLDCKQDGCDLTLEKLGGSNLSVLGQRRTPLLIDLALESYDIVRRQWKQLYPTDAKFDIAAQLIDEETYLRYLEFHEASHKEKLDQAEVLPQLEELLTNAKQFTPLYILYAHSALEVFDQSGDFKYLDDLEKVLNHAEVWSGKSILLRQSWFELAVERNDFEAAEREIDKIEALGADEALISRLRADLYRYMGQYKKADKHYRNAMALQPSRAIYNKVADNYRKWGKADKAIDTYKQSLATFPKHPVDLDLLGLVQLEQGYLDDSIKSLQQALELRPSAITSNDLGLAYMLKGDYSRANLELFKPYERGSREPILRLNLADSEALLGNTARAEELYGELIDEHLANESAVPLWVVSQVYAQLGEFEKAIQVLNQITTEDAESAFNAALVYTLSGQFIAAIAEIDRALKANFGAVWFQLPWFDRLCSQPSFPLLLSSAGKPNRCTNDSAANL